MNAEEKQYFRELTKDRTESADVLEKPSLSGVQHSVVEKYSDQAHFIYELLQNADDVEASEAQFFLYRDRLVFIHNGAKHFNVTNPATEAEDAKSDTLGHVNAITSIANSAKSGNKATIGKFGVGFKAVFQYTETPRIYDPNIVFNYLDYLLWAKDKTQSSFVFEFRNSVEHWYPRNPSEGTFEQWTHNEGVDRFGNLCIIQRNVNSKFSNMAPEAKKPPLEI